MTVNGNALKPGNVLVRKGRLYRVVTVNHVKPGKGGAYAQVSLKGVKDAGNLNERLRASEQVELARIEERPYQFLYRDGDAFVFMNNEDYEQINISKGMIGENERFLQEGMIVTLGIFDGEVISLRMPDTVVLEVEEAEAVVKGQTASASFKRAVVTGGVKVQVPKHVVTGDRIVVNIAEQSFVERAK